MMLESRQGLFKMAYKYTKPVTILINSGKLNLPYNLKYQRGQPGGEPLLFTHCQSIVNLLSTYCLPIVYYCLPIVYYCLPIVYLLFTYCLPIVQLLSVYCQPIVCLLFTYCLSIVNLLSAYCLPLVCLLSTCCLPVISLLFFNTIP